MIGRIWYVAIFAAAAVQAAVVTADSARGAALFQSLGCIQCHSINGKGGRTGPDLGRLVDRNFTPASLAATMWNHAPTMWQSMRERSIQAGEMDEQAAADLFAYFYSVRFFDKPGDAARGKRRFADRDCARCHGLTTAIQSGVKPVSEWQSLNSPFELAEAMWNHLPRIQEAARAQGIALPQLAAQDLPDLLVYVRNFPSRPAAPAEFRTTSGANGEALFQSKGCAGCHRAGSALAARIKGNTLTEIAAAMWNHAPRMAAAGARPAYFEPGEMRELLSYLWARQFFAAEGDASRGRRVFSAKNCARCHAGDSPVGPRLDAKNQSFSAPRIVAGLWRHGPAMLGQMRQQNIPWPRFTAREMADLVAYLDSSGQGR